MIFSLDRFSLFAIKFLLQEICLCWSHRQWAVSWFQSAQVDVKRCWASELLHNAPSYDLWAFGLALAICSERVKVYTWNITLWSACFFPRKVPILNDCNMWRDFQSVGDLRILRFIKNIRSLGVNHQAQDRTSKTLQFKPWPSRRFGDDGPWPAPHCWPHCRWRLWPFGERQRFRCSGDFWMSDWSLIQF